MEKRKVGALILSMGIAAALLSGCSLDQDTTEIVTDTKKPATMATTQVEEEQRKIEKKKFAAGKHVYFKRYYNAENKYAEDIMGGQITIPEGYEILDIENFTEKYGKGSQTGGFDVWFINNQEVEAEPIYNATYKTYDYSEPGRVTEVLEEEKGPELKLTP